MSVSTHEIDQKEYLKKYLSGGKKKKHKKHKHQLSNVTIIDDNTWANTNHDIDEELLLTGEDAPQIVGEVVEQMPNTDTCKWRSITIKDEPEDDFNSVKIESQNDLWGIKPVERKIKDEISNAISNIKVEKQSPPRQVKQEYNKTPPHKRNSSKNDSDLSPPRKNLDSIQQKRKYSINDCTPPRRQRRSSQEHKRNSASLRGEHKTDSDQSPPRKRNLIVNTSKNQYQRHSSPKYKRRNTTVSDQSQVRRQNCGYDRLLFQKDKNGSSKNKRESTSDSDLSPPRKHTNTSSSRHNNDSYSDLFPQRKIKSFILQSPDRKLEKSSSENKRRNKSDVDKTPPRKNETYKNKHTESRRQRQNITQSEKSKPKRKGADLEQSSSLRHQETFVENDNRVSDFSKGKRRSPSKVEGKSKTPPLYELYKQKNMNYTNKEKQRSNSPPPTHKPKATKTLDGKKAGLQDAKSLNIENEERRKAEEQLFAKMPSELSGRDAEVAVRSTGRKGRRGREAAEEHPEKIREREERAKQKKEVFDRWGKGVKQVEDRRTQMEQEAYESNKPLARYANDDDLDRYLRNQERSEDPMLEYMREKKKQQMEEANIPILPIYQGTFPENRFGIRPGYRWDGVDRSNGYEKRWFEVQNEKVAIQEEAYKYSVEDM